jgi:lipid-binding SYLF domain-containing protein
MMVSSLFLRDLVARGVSRFVVSKIVRGLALILVLVATGCSYSSGPHGSYRKIDAESREALNRLLEDSKPARALAAEARGILVFPSITKGGLIIGGQYGEGTLYEQGAVTGYYSSVGVSYGLQAGVQQFGYALFFMNDSDLEYLIKSEGWEIGAGPSVVVLDQGVATSLSTTTARKGVYAIFFEQKGLMAGIGLQGTKISRLKSSK